ncbi:hypothetical protein F7U66_00285 [Vibrio parahaemolyticus]|nr:hypothetical protein [Vibrio parahaemolyticus]
MAIVAKALFQGEEDLLIGHENEVLIIMNLDQIPVKRISPPNGGWTHDELEKVDYYGISPDGWDAFIGHQWMGSSEV